MSIEPLEPLENTIDYRNDKEENKQEDNEKQDISPLKMMDMLIIQEAKETYHSIVQDEYEFARKFCQKIPYFNAQMVRERMLLLRNRGWK